MNSDLVVMLTALNLEYEAVRSRIDNPRVHWHQAGTRFETGRLGDGCRVAIGLVGKGNHPAAVLAERAIAEFSPAAVIFAGVAGGLWPSVKLGDVVVASQVYAYHGATSEDDGPKARPRSWEISHRAGQIAQHLIRSEEWRDPSADGDGPTVHFGPIAAGEVVQDSSVSEHARWVLEHYNDALAIEMEAAGVAQAAHLNDALPVVVIRGISDRADGTKSSTDGENWQPRAAANAAAFAVALARQIVTDSTERQERNAEMGPSFRNIATGNARVGIQAGQIFGGAHAGDRADQPVDIVAAIAELRGLVRAAHQDGRLDDDTYKAAEAELDDATDHAADGTKAGRSRVMLALKRLRGLVADIAELATRLSAVIGAVRELS
ncbi:5'-methylthioadenosine/S-adenosylhomocysteine nucleosidase family protein [Actinoplanes flavus]|uniref:5'-methylthioadenosine/S-adenosylhomocysteine nucleosidase n=1 Tax=Actinoplanes flavus TaxID=2820290 RepID=A0ABS3UGU5_9ACTN|nr:5'-methylthioadenosine/S-adenosylhomocysteine nucleosidase [Actinoplanes flavus]MBO3737666.1 5'-methylthioadenosine/S-adenosylhomocysteine nucleosidase [Actinoplanes flavus]